MTHNHQTTSLNAWKKAMCTGSVLAMAMASPAFAESADASDKENSASPAEIVVTAQFRSQALQDTPLAITALTGDALEARGQTNISQIAASAPNVTLEKGEGQRGGGLIAYIRGIGQYNSAPFYEPGVGTYIDDVYLASIQGAMLNLIDLDRVEVLRGPQGTLAGKNSIGGAIKLFSRKPQGDGSGYAQLTYGRFHQVEGRAAADFKITDNLFTRINIAAKNEDGYINRLDYGCVHPGTGIVAKASPDEGCKLGTADGQNYVAGRVALRWLASDMIEVNLAGDYTKDSSQAGADQLNSLPNPAAIPALAVNGVRVNSSMITGGTYNTYSDYCNPLAAGGAGAYCNDPKGATDSWGVSGTIDINPSDSISIKSISAYRGFKSYIAVDSDGTPIPLSNLQMGMHGRQYSQELRLSGKVGDTINYTIGGFYLDSLINADQRTDIQYINFNFFNNDDTKSTSKAAYAQLSWDPVARLHLTGGIRYTKETKDYTFFRTFTDGLNTPIPGLYNLKGRYSGGHWDYRANVAFDVTDDVMIYGQYATGFKGGGTNGQPFFPDQVYAFGPENIKTWEGGAKLSLMDRRVTLNAAGFYSDYTDIQLQAQFCPPPSTPFPCAGPQNVGSAHIKGFEAELNARPIEGLQFDGSVSYLDFKYYRLNGVPTVTTSMVAPFTPKWTWSAGLQYEIPVGGFGSLTPRIDANYRSEVFTDPGNAATNRIAPRTLVNGRLTWASASKDWSLALEVTNLTNKYYYMNVIDNVAFTGSTYSYPGAPRRWSVTVKRTF